jgi:hypothetical protein
MFESELDASDAKAKLEAEGTFCYSIQSDPSSNPYGTSSSVFVRYSDLAWAKELLQNLPSVTKCNNVTESMEKKIEDNNSMAESNKPAELVKAYWKRRASFPRCRLTTPVDGGQTCSPAEWEHGFLFEQAILIMQLLFCRNRTLL